MERPGDSVVDLEVSSDPRTGKAAWIIRRAELPVGGRPCPDGAGGGRPQYWSP